MWLEHVFESCSPLQALTYVGVKVEAYVECIVNAGDQQIREDHKSQKQISIRPLSYESHNRLEKNS